MVTNASTAVTGAAVKESHTIEMMMEHHLLAELLQECFFGRRSTLAILRAEIDSEGYDLVLEAGGAIRHVQLKSSLKAGTKFKHVNRRLKERSDGCIIWMVYSVSEQTWKASVVYRWVEAADLPDRPGGKPGQIKLIPSDCKEFTAATDLVDNLFPNLPRVAPAPAIVG